MKKRLFIPNEQMKKMQRYLIELNDQAGFGCTGGKSLREKVIEKIAKKLGDKKPP